MVVARERALPLDGLAELTRHPELTAAVQPRPRECVCQSPGRQPLATAGRQGRKTPPHVSFLFPFYLPEWVFHPRNGGS
jgi:hypothetical protein